MRLRRSPRGGRGCGPPEQRGYPRLLALSAAIGVAVSSVSWCFLEFVHVIQQWSYDDLPSALGFASVPRWWPLPVLFVGGVLIAVAIGRLPGHGGHEPSQGLRAGPPTQPVELPGVLLASLATLGFGLVLGPEAPLIAVGTGVTLLALQQSKKEVPDQARLVLTSAAAFAALSTIFGNPIIGAVIIIEAAGWAASHAAVGAAPRLDRCRDRLTRVRRHGPPDRVPLDPCHLDRVQGPRLGSLLGECARRPYLPGHLPGHGSGPACRPPPRVRRDPSGGVAHRRGVRVGPAGSLSPPSSSPSWYPKPEWAPHHSSSWVSWSPTSPSRGCRPGGHRRPGRRRLLAWGVRVKQR